MNDFRQKTTLSMGSLGIENEFEGPCIVER